MPRAASKTGAAKTRSPRQPKDQTTRVLPPITVAKFEETGKLLERVVKENQSLFIEHGQEYRTKHRAGTSRPLTPAEATQLAVAITDGEDTIKRAENMQASSLRAYDEPSGREILLAAGIGVAPAFIRAATDVVALIEMPPDDFEEASEDGNLDRAIKARASELRKLPLPQARERASAAFAHYAQSAGFEPGEAWGLPVQAVRQAITTAMDHLTDASPSSQLIDSAESTADTAA